MTTPAMKTPVFPPHFDQAQREPQTTALGFWNRLGADSGEAKVFSSEQAARAAMNARIDQLGHWLGELMGSRDWSLEPASGDASFRRYYRVGRHGETFIVMDAPPEMEDSAPFVRIARQLAGMGLHVPRIHAADLRQGFLLLSDLGTQLYLDVLKDTTVTRLYGDALSALMVIQACGDTGDLPAYDEAMLLRELEIFREWLLGRCLGLSLGDEDQRQLDRTFARLAGNALEQPQVWVHRDYHSRNLMLTSPPNPGILDFQGAVRGPVTYDLVSLLRDCYIAWPRSRVEDWAMGQFELGVQSGVLKPEQERHFLRWFDLTGVQRHLKAAGIFARLHLRDGKPGYLPDIPRTLGYVLEIAQDYAELADLAQLVGERVLPAFQALSVEP